MHLLVRPGAPGDRLVGVHGDRLKIAVRAPPEKGRANQAALRLLAALLDVPASNVRLLRGRTSREKTVQVAGATPDAIRAKLRL